MVVDKRTVLNENRERVHVRWTAKGGNELTWLVNWMWRDSSVIPGGQQEQIQGNHTDWIRKSSWRPFKEDAMEECVTPVEK